MSFMKSPTVLQLATAIGLLFSVSAQASLTATVSTDIPAARAAFLAQATVLGAYDWSGTALYGVASLNFTASDGAINSIVGATSHPAPLAPSNWVNGPGFDSLDGLSSAADLALHGEESFDLVFGAPYLSVGMAVATGKSNFPTEVDLLGASFSFTALGALGQNVGSAELVLPAGAPATAWVTLVASAPIYRLQVRETASASQMDQYFSNIYATPTDVTAVPEPGTWCLMGLGLAALAARSSQRKRSL